ncbi:MAG: nucleotidyl transferase AbiEii/AbiGii toxin family protein [Clostridia bacterium]|nr:nucleotidyl transferase AbiEii/AbiGii toxin family protein [Clostridia bacterium]
MRLHNYSEDFDQLSSIVSQRLNISQSAVIRDYYIVLILDRLAKSEFAEKCVFKGGTSLSKCYPGSIERFSEDIDLTYLGIEENDKTCDKNLRKLIDAITTGFLTEKIPNEGNARNKSRNIIFSSDDKIKLEVGSSVRPDPYSKKVVKSYIHEYLEEKGLTDVIERFELKAVEINTLNIERTFIDKVMAVKRHAICGTLDRKVRHIYDVVRLYNMAEIKDFLSDTNELKRLIVLTKQTDSYYLTKRNISADYNPLGAYDFNSWHDKFDGNIKSIYESLHNSLLYTNKKQDFALAIKTFEELDALFKIIGE